MQSVKQFLGEVKVELSRVEWASKKEWLGATIITFIFVVAAAIFFGVVDRVFSIVIRKIFSFFA